MIFEAKYQRLEIIMGILILFVKRLLLLFLALCSVCFFIIFVFKLTPVANNFLLMGITIIFSMYAICQIAKIPVQFITGTGNDHTRYVFRGTCFLIILAITIFAFFISGGCFLAFRNNKWLMWMAFFGISSFIICVPYFIEFFYFRSKKRNNLIVNCDFETEIVIFQRGKPLVSAKKKNCTLLIKDNQDILFKIFDFGKESSFQVFDLEKETISYIKIGSEAIRFNGLEWERCSSRKVKTHKKTSSQTCKSIGVKTTKEIKEFKCKGKQI